MSVYEEPGKVHKKDEFEIQDNECYSTATFPSNGLSHNGKKKKKKVCLKVKYIVLYAILLVFFTSLVLLHVLYYEFYISKVCIERWSQLDSNLLVLNNSIVKLAENVSSSPDLAEAYADMKFEVIFHLLDSQHKKIENMILQSKEQINSTTIFAEVSRNLLNNLSRAYEDRFELITGIQRRCTHNILQVLSGLSPLLAVSSCAAIPKLFPSDYYWVQSSNGSAIRVYCDMTRTCGNITGGWMRVAHLDMRDNSLPCPQSLCLNTNVPQTCRICTFSATCSAEIFPIHVGYTKICGKITGYQIGNTDAFSVTHTSGFDGVSLTFQTSTRNIWTFAAAFSESYNDPDVVCPCINPGDTQIPPVPASFGNFYFCDTGNTHEFGGGNFYSNNRLWDGEGCSGHSTCCSFNNPPWFYRELPQPTLENIVMRVCRNENRDNEDIAIDELGIYVQ